MHQHQLRRACARCRGGDVTGFSLPGADAHYPPDLELAPTHLDAALRFDLQARTIVGDVTLTLTPARPGPRAIALDAVGFEDVAVTSPASDELTWRYDGNKLHITWAEAFGADARTVNITYRVDHPATGILFSGPTAAQPDAPLFACSDNETERARYWLPCVDLPSARQTLSFALRTTTGLTALANGELAGSEDHDDGTTTTRWRLDQPCPSYLSCVAIGDFVRLDDGDFGGRPLAYFTTRQYDTEHLRRSFGKTGEMLAWMTDKLGSDLPWAKYFQFAVPGIGGAMENISLVSWDSAFMLDEALEGEWSRLVDSINVHEMAHTWFGDLIVCRDFAHAWLKESWAVYMEQCWFEDKVSAAERDWEFWVNAQAYFGESDTAYARPIVMRHFHSSFEMYDRHLYPGGACRLHTLRHELGDDAFWAGVRSYVSRFAGKVVETNDFRRALEESSGRSLGLFFDQWLHSPGYPKLEVEFSYDADKSQGTFRIEQKQVDEAKGIGVFQLSLEVGWTLPGQQGQTRKITLDKTKQTVLIEMAAEPSAVRIDPNNHVLLSLSMNPGDDLLRAQLTSAPDVIGRILAARELCKTAKRANIAAVADAYGSEPFWGVRVEMARALADARTDESLAALGAIVRTEQDARALEPVVAAAGSLREAGLAAAVQARQDAGLPHRARGAAWQALGRQREDAPLDRITEAASEVDFGGFAQAGALRGLAASRQQEAMETLLAKTALNAATELVRRDAITAATALALVGSDATKARVIDTLTDLLRDPEHRVTVAAVAGLRRLSAGGAIPALEAHARRLSRQDAVGVEGAIAALSGSGSPAAAVKEAALETLQVEVRGLRKRIDELEAKLGSSA